MTGTDQPNSSDTAVTPYNRRRIQPVLLHAAGPRPGALKGVLQPGARLAGRRRLARGPHRQRHAVGRLVSRRRGRGAERVHRGRRHRGGPRPRSSSWAAWSRVGSREGRRAGLSPAETTRAPSFHLQSAGEGQYLEYARNPVKGSQHGDLFYFSLPVPDGERARRFYGELFGWDFAAPESQGGMNARNLLIDGGIGAGRDGDHVELLVPGRRSRRRHRSDSGVGGRCQRGHGHPARPRLLVSRRPGWWRSGSPNRHPASDISVERLRQAKLTLLCTSLLLTIHSEKLQDQRAQRAATHSPPAGGTQGENRWPPTTTGVPFTGISRFESRWARPSRSPPVMSVAPIHPGSTRRR